MRIYSMTATFGKLEHQTLELKPGLNVIEAPNEWGKSTWCAFLVTMLYGLDTRQKTTRQALADKERFAPWSGAPMAGRIDLNWEGRDITIERSTKGRTPLGEFRAYETESGLPVHGLTALNCGQQLLGVERGVFTRAGFIRLSDMPVTQDEALRRRLNSLVTTGDESGAGDKLAQKLKDLKNRCRFNRTGLLPQAEAQREELERKLSEITGLHTQTERLQQRQLDAQQRLQELENHKAALRYEASKDSALRIQQARATRNAAARRLELLEYTCRDIPSREEAVQAVRTIHEINQKCLALQMEVQMLPQQPQAPAVPPQFIGMQPRQAVDKAQQDRDAYGALSKKKWLALLLLGMAATVTAVGLLIVEQIIGALVCAIAGAALLITRAVLGSSRSKKLRGMEKHYGARNPDQWVEAAQTFAHEQDVYDQELQEYTRLRGDLDRRLQQLQSQRTELTGGQDLTDHLEQWNQVIKAWDDCGDARREIQRWDANLQTMEAMAQTVPAPELPDSLTYTEEATARLISDAQEELRRIQTQLGVCQGKIEALGSEEPIRTRLRAVQGRIARLEETYTALDYAQKALTAASHELQRRFAPRISKRAQELFGMLTDGRYDRLTLAEDLSLNAGAQGEDTLHSSQWRSDGTADQLYLALRLAVAEELTPDAPLVLDDALVRFDEQRLEKAMQILHREAEHKQVILFTCQSREKKHLS